MCFTLAFESLDQLDEADKEALRREVTHKWHQPRELYYMVALCSMAACVQGVGSKPIQSWIENGKLV